MAISLPEFGAALAALSALSTAAFGLVDASKGLWGGVSRIGLGHIRAALAPFGPALAAAMGRDRWWDLIQANWMNGVGKAEQKAVARSLIKLGLTEETAPAIATAVNVDPGALTAVARKLARGTDLSDADLNLLGRLNAVLDALLDSGFERAEQKYRNVTRLWAGAAAIGLAMAAWALWPASAGDKPDVWVAFAVGLLSVPIAPVAKDLTSALSSAMRALKATRAI